MEVEENYDADKKEYALTLTQTSTVTEKQPVKLPFHIPLRIGLIGSGGEQVQLNCEDVVLNSDKQPLINFKQKMQTFIFSKVAEKPVLSLNREFSAPIKLIWNATQADLLHQIKFDVDDFNRREAGYKMNLQELRRLVTNAIAGKTLAAQPEVIEAMGFVIKDKKIDSEFKALMLQLPDQGMLAQEESVLDAVAFTKAYDCFYNALLQNYQNDILELYEKQKKLDTAGDRALKGQLLRILVKGHYVNARDLASEQYFNAKNMTDKLGALSALCHTDGPQKEKALQAFYDEWKDDAVVYNKWLQVQAASSLPNTFSEVKLLAQTKPFSMDVPNNVYALLRTFGANYLAMSDESGETYKWFCDRILEIDGKNPQVAARLCVSFNFVKKLPLRFKEKAQHEIQRVLSSTALSRNSRELLEGCV